MATSITAVRARNQINCNNMDSDTVRFYEKTSKEWGVSLSVLGTVVLRENVARIASYKDAVLLEHSKRRLPVAQKRDANVTAELQLLRKELAELKKSLGG